MKPGERRRDKQLYAQLRRMSCERLWEEAARFDESTPPERSQRVAVIRAVGVVFSESGAAQQKNAVRLWLRRLLNDPCEKIRRYAMAALPKIGAGPSEEADLLSLLRTTAVEREKKYLAQTLEKIGGTATLEEMNSADRVRLVQTEQKIKASLARRLSPSEVRMGSILSSFAGLRIHLRGRRGLEQIVRAEVEESPQARRKFQIAEVRGGLVAIRPVAAFSLTDLYALRCFGTVGFVLGTAPLSGQMQLVEALATAITSPLSRRILETFTEGPIRYRLDFVSKGHQRSLVRLLANRVYALRPEILNDAREARWVVAIYPGDKGSSVELCPKLTRDPRFYYRRDDVPAASHPPLAACMARLAGRMEQEIVWDPFCGSGLELIERALLGGVRGLYGTDHNEDAIAIARKNFAAADIRGVEPKFARGDFRDAGTIADLGPGSVTLVITNPPMGNRVPVPDLRRLIDDLFSVAATVLKPGGRLVFANPLRMECPSPLLQLQSRQVIDLGGFNCRLEKYLKSPLQLHRLDRSFRPASENNHARADPGK